jgi:queuosine precursor transporter
MTRALLPGVLAMAVIVVASNVLVQFLLFDGLLTWGAFTYPFAFLVTDLMNRVYGPTAARKVIFAGFVTGIICSLIGTKITLQGDGFTYQAVAFRVAIASATAFLIAQLVDVAIFDRLRSGKWWKAPFVSSIVGSAVDTAIFFTLAFAQFVTFFGANADAEINWAWNTMPFLTTGPEAPLWVTFAVADWILKTAIALIALVPFRLIVGRLVARVA